MVPCISRPTSPEAMYMMTLQLGSQFGRIFACMLVLTFELRCKITAGLKGECRSRLPCHPGLAEAWQGQCRHVLL